MTFDNVFWSDVVGYIGLSCWFIVMTPQIYANWKLKNASSLSPGYVTLSLAGNLLSCTGAILGGLIFTSILVTGYLSLLGFVLLYQIYIYRLPEDDISTNIEWRPTENEQHFVTQPRSIRSRMSFLPSYEPVISSVEQEYEGHKRQPSNSVGTSELPPNAIMPGSYNESSPLIGAFEGGPTYSSDSFHSHRSRAASILSARSSIFSQTLNQHIQKQRSSIVPNRPGSFISHKTRNSINRISIVSTFTYPPTAPPPTPSAQSNVITIGALITSIFIALIVKFSPSPHSIADTLLVPQTLGWMSGMLFIAGRSAQLYKNYLRKSVEGLSGIMFIISIIGNINYILAMLLFSIEESYIIFNLPWLAGSICGLSLDMIVVFQFFLYQDNCIPYDALPNEDVDEFQPIN